MKCGQESFELSRVFMFSLKSKYILISVNGSISD